jgi:hypothetical protein
MFNFLAKGIETVVDVAKLPLSAVPDYVVDVPENFPMIRTTGAD